MHVLVSFLCTVYQIDCLVLKFLYIYIYVWTDICTLYLFYVSEINIYLSNVFTKVVEKVLYIQMEDYLQYTHNQFGFKQKHGT